MANETLINELKKLSIDELGDILIEIGGFRNAQVDKDGKALGNVVPSKVGDKFYKNFEDNVYGAEQMNASYKRYPQPVDQAGESTEQGALNLKKGAAKSQKILNQLESVENKNEKIISEEINRMKKIVDYNQKTQ